MFLEFRLNRTMSLSRLSVEDTKISKQQQQQIIIIINNNNNNRPASVNPGIWKRSVSTTGCPWIRVTINTPSKVLLYLSNGLHKSSHQTIPTKLKSKYLPNIAIFWAHVNPHALLAESRTKHCSKLRQWFFVGNHKKTITFIGLSCLPNTKWRPTMNSYSRTTLNLNQVGKIIVAPVPFIYITCTFPAFPMCFHATFSSQGVVASIISRLPKRS